MDNNMYGNRITDNALKADDGTALIACALEYVKTALGWYPLSTEMLFSGIYYDSHKVGSYLVRVRNDRDERAVLKLQLRPLPFDEGSIIRHVNKHNRSKKIRMPHVLHDAAWNERLGFGYLLFEDMSALADLWQNLPTREADRRRHRDFLAEFLHQTLPMPAWLEQPKAPLVEVYKKNFQHFKNIADQSAHRQIDQQSVQAYVDCYFDILNRAQLEENLHFTHGHLSGKDVKYDASGASFVTMANLFWSYRPRYYELTFPIWVDIMHIRDHALTLPEVLERTSAWGLQWQSGLYDHDPTTTPQYWFNLLERAMLTIMLDLGASEWKEPEQREKQALLEVWQKLFIWIAENKF